MPTFFFDIRPGSATFNPTDAHYALREELSKRINKLTGKLFFEPYNIGGSMIEGPAAVPWSAVRNEVKLRALIKEEAARLVAAEGGKAPGSVGDEEGREEVLAQLNTRVACDAAGVEVPGRRPAVRLYGTGIVAGANPRSADVEVAARVQSKNSHGGASRDYRQDPPHGEAFDFPEPGAYNALHHTVNTPEENDDGAGGNDEGGAGGGHGGDGGSGDGRGRGLGQNDIHQQKAKVFVDPGPVNVGAPAGDWEHTPPPMDASLHSGDGVFGAGPAAQPFDSGLDCGPFESGEQTRAGATLLKSGLGDDSIVSTAEQELVQEGPVVAKRDRGKSADGVALFDAGLTNDAPRAGQLVPPNSGGGEEAGTEDFPEE